MHGRQPLKFFHFQTNGGPITNFRVFLQTKLRQSANAILWMTIYCWKWTLFLRFLKARQIRVNCTSVCYTDHCNIIALYTLIIRDISVSMTTETRCKIRTLWWDVSKWVIYWSVSEDYVTVICKHFRRTRFISTTGRKFLERRNLLLNANYDESRDPKLRIRIDAWGHYVCGAFNGEAPRGRMI